MFLLWSSFVFYDRECAVVWATPPCVQAYHPPASSLSALARRRAATPIATCFVSSVGAIVLPADPV
jgi:hypothetical protein